MTEVNTVCLNFISDETIKFINENYYHLFSLPPIKISGIIVILLKNNEEDILGCLIGFDILIKDLENPFSIRNDLYYCLDSPIDTTLLDYFLIKKEYRGKGLHTILINTMLKMRKHAVSGSSSKLNSIDGIKYSLCGSSDKDKCVDIKYYITELNLTHIYISDFKESIINKYNNVIIKYNNNLDGYIYENSYFNRNEIKFKIWKFKDNNKIITKASIYYYKYKNVKGFNNFIVKCCECLNRTLNVKVVIIHTDFIFNKSKYLTFINSKYYNYYHKWIWTNKPPIFYN